MELVEDLGAKVNKRSYINEYINLFARSRSSFDLKPIIRFIQMMSLTFGLFTQVSHSGPQDPLVLSIHLYMQISSYNCYILLWYSEPSL